MQPDDVAPGIAFESDMSVPFESLSVSETVPDVKPLLGFVVELENAEKLMPTTRLVTATTSAVYATF